MSLLNKFMHPRNIYKTPPDFKQLAIDFPEFRAFAKQDISGKIMIDFKDQTSLRALTTTLLKKDFDLNVEIPINHLVPTLPLRLNYLLWIEDLLEATEVGKNSDPVLGFDIGTGAIAIYPLLAAKKNKWHMKATEVDVESLEYAKKNVEANNLQEFIEIQQVSDGTILKGVCNNELTYDFSMCNPPFFSSERDLNATKKSRSLKRPSPHNAQTGVLGEVVTTGGEVEFVKQMITESAEMKTKVRIYTTMTGHKSSVNVLKGELEKVGAVSWTQTEFCQGHTTRWGLAWTFIPDLTLITHLPTVSRKKEQKKPVMRYVIPRTWNKPEYNVTAACTLLENILDELNIVYEDTSRNKHRATYTVIAVENTWCNQRRKRREMKQNTQLSMTECEDKETRCKRTCEVDDTKQGGNKRQKLNCEQNENLVTVHGDEPLVKEDTASESRQVENSSPGRDGNVEDTPSQADKESSVLLTAPQAPPLLKALIIVRKICGEINIEMSWLDGTLGRDGLHQVLQYIKNNFIRQNKV